MKKLISAFFTILLCTILFVNVNSFAYAEQFDYEDGITYHFDKKNGELCIEGYGMSWAVWSIQYCLNFDENIDSSEVKKLLVKDGLTILDCHSLVGTLFEWENLTEMTLPKSIKKIQGDFSKCPSLKTINYAGTKEDWDKIIFRDNQKELFSKMDFNYSVNVPKSDSGFAGKGNEIVSVKIQPDEKITCTLDCITEQLVVSGNGPLYIPSNYYDAFFSVSRLFTVGTGQDDTWMPKIKDIVIENGITKLCEYNFDDIYNSVVIPKSVTEIEENCFGEDWDDQEAIENYREAENKKMDVYYEGSKEDWDKIKIGDLNGELINGNIHYNSDKINAYNIDKEPSNTVIIAVCISAVVLIAAVAGTIVIKKKKNNQ